MAVGRLGVAFSDRRPPRLVVDSSVCGLNNRCELPESTTLPSAKDVIICFPLRDCRTDLAGFSLDIKSARKRVGIRESEQGLLGFQLNGILYFYRVCPFGETFSAFWWPRLGAWILTFVALWLQHRQVLSLVATFLAMTCQTLGIPISWRKAELDSFIHWIGWAFHFVAGYIEIPQDKRDRALPGHTWKRLSVY